ncbi:MAG: DUF2304 domain-containing protein [Chloroflexi bacterium]|nr:DUF2304 domain-containing protein [Chloroflexota bacterium]
MIWRARLFFVALGLVVLIFVVNLVRTKRLKEEYALLWLFMAATLVIAPLLIDVIDAISFAIGIDYPPALIIVIALVCFALIFFQISVTISRFSDQIKVLTQELALTRERVRELEQRFEKNGNERPGE